MWGEEQKCLALSLVLCNVTEECLIPSHSIWLAGNEELSDRALQTPLKQASRLVVAWLVTLWQRTVVHDCFSCVHALQVLLQVDSALHLPRHHTGVWFLQRIPSHSTFFVRYFSVLTSVAYPFLFFLHSGFL